MTGKSILGIYGRLGWEFQQNFHTKEIWASVSSQNHSWKKRENFGQKKKAPLRDVRVGDILEMNVCVTPLWMYCCWWCEPSNFIYYSYTGLLREVLFVCLSSFWCECVSQCVFVCLFLCLYLNVCLCFGVCLFLSVWVWLAVSPSVFWLSLSVSEAGSLSECESLCLCVHLYHWVCFSVSLCPSVCLCLWLCGWAWVSLSVSLCGRRRGSLEKRKGNFTGCILCGLMSVGAASALCVFLWFLGVEVASFVTFFVFNSFWCWCIYLGHFVKFYLRVGAPLALCVFSVFFCRNRAICTVFRFYWVLVLVIVHIWVRYFVKCLLNDLFVKSGMWSWWGNVICAVKEVGI